MYRLQVKRHFDSAHQIKDYEGKCGGLHGHRWDVEVVLESRDLDSRNIAIDFGDVKKEIDKLIDWPNGLDHSILNAKLDEPNITAEFLAKWFYDRLSVVLPGVVRVTIWESPDCCVKYCPEVFKATGK
jgi:6-pyruvoyltetrahydropterin/6-carboxytetrahydropterin synthase